MLARPGQAAEALQMIVHLDRFWHHRGHTAEADALTRRGLDAVGPDLSAAVRCGALFLAGHAASRHGQQAARAFFTKSLQTARAADNEYHAARALRGLTYVSAYAGDRGKQSVQPARPPFSLPAPWATQCCSASA